MRKMLRRNYLFYLHYPYSPQLENPDNVSTPFTTVTQHNIHMSIYNVQSKNQYVLILITKQFFRTVIMFGKELIFLVNVFLYNF